MLEEFAQQLPLELFVFVGSFIEEAVSPIPSFVVLIPAGAAARVQGTGWCYLLVLALFSAMGRVIASMLLYVIADKSEDWLLGRGRRFFGVTHKQLQGFGKRFSGSPCDWFVLFLLNAIPVIPTSLLSLACGFTKLDFRTFVTATFVGTATNAVIYMSIGYAGIRVAENLHDFELVAQIVGIVLLVALVGWFFRHKQKRGR